MHFKPNYYTKVIRVYVFALTPSDPHPGFNLFQSKFSQATLGFKFLGWFATKGLTLLRTCAGGLASGVTHKSRNSKV